MLEVLRYGARHRLRGTLYLTVGVSLLVGMVVWIYPSMSAAMDLESLLAAYPEPVRKALGVETLASLEGFLAIELYNFAWVLLFGLYFAYAAAGLVADAVEHDRMDLWLALPIRRRRLLVEQYLTLLVPILVLNVVTPAVVYGASVLIDDPLAVGPLLMVHALSVPYLLCSAAVGLVFGTLVSRAAVAERAALALVFSLYLLESLLTGTAYEEVGYLAPTRYYDVNDILVRGQYDYVAAGVLVAATLVLLAVAAAVFARRDIR